MVIRILLTVFPKLYFTPCGYSITTNLYFLIPSPFSPILWIPLLSGNCENVPCNYESVSVLLVHLFFSDTIVNRYVFIAILLFIVLRFFFLLKEDPFNTFYNADLVVMNSFSFFLSGKLFICPPILNDSFVGQSNLGCRYLLFITLNIPCHLFLACKVSVEISADSLMGAPLQVTNCFSLAAFKILSLSLTFCILIMMCLAVGLFGSILFGTICTSWTYMSISFTTLGKFSVIIFFKWVFNFLLALFSLQHPHEIYIGMLEVVPEAPYTLFILLNSFFLFAVLIGCFLLPYIPNWWFDSQLYLLYVNSL